MIIFKIGGFIKSELNYHFQRQKQTELKMINLAWNYLLNVQIRKTLQLQSTLQDL